MSTPFGPQLIGETEKTLNALLAAVPRRDRTHRASVGDAAAGRHARRQRRRRRPGRRRGRPCALPRCGRSRQASLTDRGLLDNGRLTSAGRELTAAVQATITTETAPIWDDLPADDVAAATRVLNEVVTRARAVLG